MTEFVLRHRRWVFAFWALMFLAGAALAGKTTDRLSFDFSLPGQPGYETEVQILATYGNGGSNPPYIPVVTVPKGTTVDEQSEEIAQIFAAVQEAVPEGRLVDYAMTGGERFVTEDGRTTYALVFPPQFTGFRPGIEAQIEPVLEQQTEAAGFAGGLTGYNLLSAGGENEEPSVLVETLIGAFGALLVLAFVFASFLAFVPLVVAAVSILSTFLLVLLLTTFTDVSFIVQFLISLVGLGVAIDYSLLVVSR